MQAFAVLIAHPDDPILTQDIAANLGGPVTWLNPGIACEAPIECDDPILLESDLRARFDDLAIDIAVVPAEGRRKQLLIADMDSTIITVECLDELADEAGLKPRIAAITERAMRGELDFESALRERVGLLAGLDQAALQRTYDNRVRLMPGARVLVRTMAANCAYAALVSGGFTFFTQRVAALCGFHDHRANQLELAQGQLTGKVIEPILGRAAKLAALEEFASAKGIDPTQALAVGDGANDLAMITRAGMGVAYHAKPIVAEQARYRIDHGDLTALLYLQGFGRVDFKS
jgi:phosphoserine phosphatase